MSAFATNTRRDAPSTKRSFTTNKALPERLSDVTIALMGSQPTIAKADLEVKTWQVEFFAEGGYNLVWLLSYTIVHKVR